MNRSSAGAGADHFQEFSTIKRTHGLHCSQNTPHYGYFIMYSGIIAIIAMAPRVLYEPLSRPSSSESEAASN